MGLLRWLRVRRTSLVAAAVLTLAPFVWIAIPLAQVAQQSYTPVTVTLLSPEQEHALKPKDAFKECATCPQMMVVPAGSFFMGSPPGERGRDNDEGPQHRVAIARQFAVGQFALTFDEWDACAAARGCNGYKPFDEGWGRSRRPVINVSWNDAKAYVAWLSRKTGKIYRLLTETEYEYVTRAGTQTTYPWGDAIGSGNAHCKDCGSEWDYNQTVPVGSFAANGFGLYDMVGNVYEWTEDCWHDNYNGAPTDGSAWMCDDKVRNAPLSCREGGNCIGHVLRGGTWSADDVRSASRRWSTNVDRQGSTGFRVARTPLAP
jgi:formylglycine-generating enzyme required for sulfatase activity